MNLLNNWVDVSYISTSGWGGTKIYNVTNHYIELTAKNGWNSFFWNIPVIKGKNIIFEFDYKFTNTDNWSDCWIINGNSYGGIANGNISKKTDWTHFRKEFSSANTYIGLNVRGVDNTGKLLSIAMKNIQLRFSDSTSNKLCRNGEVITSEIIENNNELKLYKNSIYSNQFIEY